MNQLGYRSCSDTTSPWPGQWPQLFARMDTVAGHKSKLAHPACEYRACCLGTGSLRHLGTGRVYSSSTPLQMSMGCHNAENIWNHHMCIHVPEAIHFA